MSEKWRQWGSVLKPAFALTIPQKEVGYTQVYEKKEKNNICHLIYYFINGVGHVEKCSDGCWAII